MANERMSFWKFNAEQFRNRTVAQGAGLFAGFLTVASEVTANKMGYKGVLVPALVGLGIATGIHLWLARKGYQRYMHASPGSAN
jgi:hypothetical protein